MSSWGGIFDYDAKAERLEEVELELGAPDVWDNQDHAQKLGKERAGLELVVETIRDLSRTFDEISELLDLAINEEDESTFEALLSDTQVLEEKLEILETKVREGTLREDTRSITHFILQFTYL